MFLVRRKLASLFGVENRWRVKVVLALVYPTIAVSAYILLITSPMTAQVSYSDIIYLFMKVLRRCECY